MSSLTRYERFDNNGLELVIDTQTGESFATVRGYARMAGLDHSAISKRLSRSGDKIEVKTTEIQTDKGIRAVTLINEATISQWIIRDNPDLALKIMQAGVRVFLHTSAGYTVKSGEPSNGEPYWYARLKQFRQDNPVPEGYFSIFEETINLVAEFEALDCIIPDSAIPDISIGKHWATYLRTERNIEPNKICTTYPHTYPGKYDKRGTQSANAYPEDMLPLFRQWFRSTYRPQKLPAYIKRQHKGLLPVVGQLLGLSMAEMKRLK